MLNLEYLPTRLIRQPMLAEKLGQPLRLGIIGCGRVFERFYLPAISRTPALSLVAACDTDRGRLAWAEHRSSAPALFGTPADLFRYQGLEAVLVLTPPASHALNVIQALQAGLHVLVEKPMALNPAEAGHMAETARLVRRHLQVGFSRRFREPYQALRRALQRKQQPTIRRVHFELSFPTMSWKAESDFLGKESHGGGVLDDVLSHQVDLVCWLMGDWPRRVRCEVNVASGQVRAELEIGGASVHCESAHSRYAERLQIELTDNTVLEASGSHLREGRPGLERWRRGRALVLDRISLINDRLLRRPNVSLRSFENQLHDFSGAIRGETSQGASADDGVRTVEVVDACRESVRQAGTWQAIKTTAGPAA